MKRKKNKSKKIKAYYPEQIFEDISRVGLPFDYFNFDDLSTSITGIKKDDGTVAAYLIRNPIVTQYLDDNTVGFILRTIEDVSRIVGADVYRYAIDEGFQLHDFVSSNPEFGPGIEPYLLAQKGDDVRRSVGTTIFYEEHPNHFFGLLCTIVPSQIFDFHFDNLKDYLKSITKRTWLESHDYDPGDDFWTAKSTALRKATQKKRNKELQKMYDNIRMNGRP